MVEKATVQRDYYEGNQPGFTPNGLENWLGITETEVSPIIDQLEALPRLTSAEDRGKFLFFIALQIQRGRDVRPALTSEADPDADLNFVARFHIHAQRIFETLIEMRITFIRFDEPCLYIADTPVAPYFEQDGFEPDIGRDFSSVRRVTMPLSRSLAAVLYSSDDLRDSQILDVPHGDLDAVVEGTADLAVSINNSTEHASYQWVYMHPDDEHTFNKEKYARSERSYSLVPFTNSKNDVVSGAEENV